MDPTCRGPGTGWGPFWANIIHAVRMVRRLLVAVYPFCQRASAYAWQDKFPVKVYGIINCVGCLPRVPPSFTSKKHIVTLVSVTNFLLYIRFILAIKI
jgi:hypothetical protein